MRIGRPRFFALGALSVLVLAGIHACTEVSVTATAVDRIEITPAEASLLPGGSMRLNVEITDSEGRALPDREVVWESTDPSVVIVSSRGLVTAVGVGSATVRATSEGVTDSASVTVGQGPVIRLGQDAVTLTGIARSPGARTAVVKVSNPGGGVLDGLSTTIVYGPVGSGWLTGTVNPTTAPADLVLSAHAENLAAGTYTADLRVSSPTASNSPQTVRVQFNVAEGDPSIRVSPGVVGFTATAAEPSPASQTLLVTNEGGGQITGLTRQVRYVVGPPGWLTATLGSGTAPTTLGLSVNVQGLPVAVYEARVDVSSPNAANSPFTVVVTLRVGEPSPSLGLSTDALSFTAFQEGPLPAQQTVQLTNLGGGTLSGIAASASYAGATGWLGLSLGAMTAPTDLRVAPLTTNLEPGTYAGAVVISSPVAANSPRTVPVTYQIHPRADLAITKQATPNPVAPGGKLSYTIVVTNAGPSTATAVVVTEKTPAGLTLDSSVASRGAYAAGPEEWTIGTMLRGASATLTLVFSVPAGTQGPIENVVTVSSAVDDPQIVNNTAAVLVGVGPLIAPSNLVAVAGSSSQINLTWTDNSSNETGFEVQRSTNAGTTWDPLATLGANVTAYSNTGLVGGTTYHYRVRATNSFMQSAYTAPAFATTPLAVPPGQAPTATTEAATGVTMLAATLNGTVNPNGAATTVRFEWSLQSNLATSTLTPVQNLSAGTSAVAVNAAITGLLPGTPHYFRVVATNATGTTNGAILSFTTSNVTPPSVAPTATTQAASGVTATTATLNGSVNPNGPATAARFEWSLFPDLSLSTLTAVQNLPAGTAPVNVSAEVTPLLPLTTYYFRVVSTNANGTTNGAILSFATPLLPL